MNVSRSSSWLFSFTLQRCNGRTTFSAHSRVTSVQVRTLAVYINKDKVEECRIWSWSRSCSPKPSKMSSSETRARDKIEVSTPTPSSSVGWARVDLGFHRWNPCGDLIPRLLTTIKETRSLNNERASVQLRNCHETQLVTIVTYLDHYSRWNIRGIDSILSWNKPTLWFIFEHAFSLDYFIKRNNFCLF